MSGAGAVPETWERRGDDVWSTLLHTGWRRLFVGALVRLRAADGFSHARALAFATALVAVQGVVALVGLAGALDREGVREAVQRVVQATAPGAVGSAMTAAIDRAHGAGEPGSFVALALGLAGALVAATTAMGQLQRSLNRLYGVERDRPTARKYAVAFLLAASAGASITVAFGSIAFGAAVGDALSDHALTPVWGVVRVPFALVLTATAVAALLRWCPSRRQPGWSWLTPGAAVSVALWTASTVVLNLVFRSVPSLGDAYGPLAVIVALLFWSFSSSVALLYGAAVAAQLEAMRAVDVLGSRLESMGDGVPAVEVRRGTPGRSRRLTRPDERRRETLAG